MMEDIALVSSTHRENTFFIFRECGSEVEVKVSGSKYWASKTLSEEEKEYLETNLI